MSRTFVVSGAVSKAERDEIRQALKAAGFQVHSAGVRAILLAFARSESVKRAVMEHLEGGKQ